MARKGGTAANTNILSFQKEACKTTEGVIVTLAKKFRPQHNEMLMSLQYCKPKRTK